MFRMDVRLQHGGQFTLTGRLLQMPLHELEGKPASATSMRGLPQRIRASADVNKWVGKESRRHVRHRGTARCLHGHHHALVPEHQ